MPHPGQSKPNRYLVVHGSIFDSKKGIISFIGIHPFIRCVKNSKHRIFAQMKGDFEIGDKVSLMDENLNGIVKAINKDCVVLTIEDGFDMEVNLAQLVPFQELDFSMGDITRIKLEKNDNIKPKKTLKTSKKKTYIEFDLHIDKLHPNWKTLDKSNYLNYQLSAAQGKLDFAINKRIPHFVFIHGVGEGVLKQELHTILGRYDFLVFEDAPYYKYGLGATLVSYKL